MSVLYFKSVDTTFPRARRAHQERTRAALADTFAVHRRRVLSRYRNGIFQLFDVAWGEQVAQVTFEQNKATASDLATRTVAEMVGKQDFNPDVMDPWLRENARIAATRITDTVEHDVNQALIDGSDGIAAVFEVVLTAGVSLWATSMVTTVGNFATHDAARATGGRTKTWQVNSGNPRSSHAALDGETVPMSENFSNGMPWPGWFGGGADEIAGCQCSLVVDL